VSELLLKKRLNAGENLLGTMINIVDHPDIVKILQVCGFDYFIIDCEHGYMDYSKVAILLAYAREAGIGGFVRVPGPSREAILRYMDMGAAGLMMPNVDTGEQAKALVEHAKYAPLGNRGVSIMRAQSGYNPGMPQAQYMEKMNNETILIVQIESRKAVENIAEIIGTPGIDLAFIGPNDLCLSLGIPGGTDRPEFLEAVQKIIDACAKAKKHSGIQAMTPELMKSWISKGMKFNLYANEVTMLLNMGKEAVAKIKAV
jgi:2-dehydro-3-deoxyglucarate aldolase/4-hydroxy-2-oxoheptanedioate aldolase